MKKLRLLLISMVMVVCFAACSQKKDVSDTPAEIEKKIADALGKDKYLCDTNVSEEEFYKFYELDKAQVESFVAKENSNSKENPDHVVIMKVKEDYTKTAVDSLNKAYGKIVESVRKSNKGLGKTLNAKIYEQDGYVGFFLTGTKYDGDSSEQETKIANKDYETIQNTWKETFGDTPSNLAIVPPAK